MAKKLLLLCLFLPISVLLFSQTVRLSGKIVNQKNEPVAGATISVPGIDRAMAADIEGRFSLLLDASKKHNITVSSAGYGTKIVEDIELKANEENTVIITLEAGTLEEVVIRTSVRKESTAALINFQRNNTAVSSGVAADFIRRTPDKNTGEILKRVSGASIQDNKFVVVRGLGDRYNTAFLNGAQLPSSEPDKKAFSFDVIPSSVVENIIINKTATPDLTGEFAGGLIQVTTRDVPNKNFVSAGVTLGYNTQSTFKDFVHNQRSSTDQFGFSDDRRNIPAGFPVNRQSYNALLNRTDGQAKQIVLSRLFRDDVYQEETSTAGPVQTYNIAWGTGKKFRNDGSLGTVVSLLYRKSELLYDVERALYEQDGNPLLSFNDRQNKYNVNLGAMANISYVKGKHKISFKNLFNRYLEDNYYLRSGPNTDRGGMVDLRSSVMNQRTFYTGILEGNHQFTPRNIKFYWNAAYSLNDKEQPDLRTAAFFSPGFNNGAYLWDQDDTRRFFSRLRDHGFSLNGALTIPFTIWDEKQNLKIGGSSLLRFRDFKSRIFRYVESNATDFDPVLSSLPFDRIFNRANINRNGFVLEEFTNNEDKYFAVSALNAGYVMFDNKLNEKLRVIWGARIEFFEQFLQTKDRSAKRVIINSEQWSLLPSINASYELNDQHIVRMAAAKTVSRPEFREIAPFQFFDYESTFGVRGNQDLKMTDIYNFDLRYEIYPAPGEAITIGGFYKRFVNPIEFRLGSESVTTRRNYFFQNAKDANTFGIELEGRKNLRFLGGNTEMLSNFSLFANFTYIFSQVTFNDELLGKVVSADRPVQGQSPYLLNGGLQYSSKSTGWNATLLYNRMGNRLTLVGYNSLGFPDVYENPRDVIDLQVSKKIFKGKGEVKLTYGDILNEKMILYENTDKSRSFKKGTDRIFSSYTPGSMISLGFTYDFDYNSN